MKVTGEVKFFHDDRGYGFITRSDGGGDVFLHATEIRKGRLGEVKEGDRLTFEVEKSTRGQKAVKLGRE